MRFAFVLRLGNDSRPADGFFEGWIEEVDSYNYADDAEFQLGLANILQHAQSHEQSNELELKARCFYFAR